MQVLEPVHRVRRELRGANAAAGGVRGRGLQPGAVRAVGPVLPEHAVRERVPGDRRAHGGAAQGAAN